MNGISTMSVKAAFHTYVRAKTEGRSKKPTTGSPAADLHAIVSLRTKANAGALSDSDVPHEVLHCLIDYRDGNRVVAAKHMNHRRAFTMNHRLKGTGFAWAAKTGY